MKNHSKNRKNRLRRRHNERYGFYYAAPCPFCGRPEQFHFDRYDAACCLHCNVWLEAACGDPRCPDCANRPESPLLALFLAEERPADALERKTWRRENYDHQERGRLRKSRRLLVKESKEDV